MTAGQEMMNQATTMEAWSVRMSRGGRFCLVRRHRLLCARSPHYQSLGHPRSPLVSSSVAVAALQSSAEDEQRKRMRPMARNWQRRLTGLTVMWTVMKMGVAMIRDDPGTDADGHHGDPVVDWVLVRVAKAEVVTEAEAETATAW